MEVPFDTGAVILFVITETNVYVLEILKELKMLKCLDASKLFDKLILHSKPINSWSK